MWALERHYVRLGRLFSACGVCGWSRESCEFLEGQVVWGYYLDDLFPTLLTCSSHREATIENVLTRPDSRGVREWNVTFIRDFNDWEVEVVVAFFQFRHSHTVPNAAPTANPDSLRWKLCKDGAFASRSFYYALSDRLGVSFLWKAFGWLKLLLEWLSLYGQRLGVRF